MDKQLGCGVFLEGADFKNVADSMVTDGLLNWGRVVSLITFCCYVTKKRILEDGVKCDVGELAGKLAKYFDDELKEKLKALGGWVGCALIHIFKLKLGV
jgi:hypothetical protein